MANSSSRDVGHRRALALRLLAIGLLLALIAPARAAAVLGGDVTSVEVDRAHMRGTVRRVPSETYAVHEIAAPSGTIVREYISPRGTIFAVAWEGPWMPDLRQLLGTYFEPYASARATGADRLARGPVVLRAPGLVVELSGHARAFWGRAYAPEMLPARVGTDAIR